METIYQLTVGSKTLFSFISKEEEKELVFESLESAIRGTDNIYGTVSDEETIIKDNEEVGEIEERQEVDPVLVQKVSKVAGVFEA